MPINLDFSDFPAQLRQFALSQFVYLGFITFDETTNTLSEAPDAANLRKAEVEADPYARWVWWLRFGVGVECLFKAAFLHNNISLITKKNVLNKTPKGSNPLMTPEAAKVYAAVSIIKVTANTNVWLESIFSNEGISHPFEINTGTLGDYKNNLGKLKAAGIISNAEKTFLSDTITVLSDFRRNVDAHVYLKQRTSGSINDDLTKLYIPACNILLGISI